MGLWDEAEDKAKAGFDSTPDDDDQDFDALKDDNLDVDEDVEEPEEGDVEEETEDADLEAEKKTKESPDDTGLTPGQQQQVKDQVLKMMGQDAVLKIRGVEKKASELSPREFTVFLQKGMDADQLYQRHAQERKAFELERAKFENEALALQSRLREAAPSGGLPANAKELGLVTELPEYLKPTADDPPEVLSWKESQAKLLDEHNAMKTYLFTQAQQSKNSEKVNEVLALRDTYPMASIDEVLAVKGARPDIASEELMRASHNYYSGADFIKKSLDSNPTFKREYDAEVIKNYLSRKSGAPKIPGNKKRGAGVDKVSFGVERKNFRGTFDDADRLSREYARQMNKMERES